jgi:hypothetical protein
VLPLEGDRKPVPVLQTEFNEVNGQFSPDGRWIAYESDESTPAQVYVQGFPNSRGKVQMGSFRFRPRAAAARDGAAPAKSFSISVRTAR